MMNRDNPVWLITGCSTGFGRELAKLVLERGWRAVVTARDASKVKDIAEPHGERALVLPLDVTNRAQIAEVVAQAKQRFGRIDALVNNAGYGYLAAIEEGEDAEVRAMFETNVFGLVDITKAVLPVMREQRSGLIVNVSSIGGLASFAATGYYHATKYAVEGLSETLAAEVKPLGIDVLIVEPGPFRTNWAGASMKQSATVIDDYAATAGERRKQTEARSGNQAGDPVRAAQAIIDAALSDKPPLRLLLGKTALELARKKLDFMRGDFDAWEATTVGADYPDA
ncbi:oxidoreductase [Paraburkholderia graminis]|jgi:NAD(P)-dependent dehydrogenase (short-subunit alcohol dehydrogenase family)|uniref:Short-chain dehydrogenase/reductase SDR n=1 Tax=Paraburkholderia graminis (strain ATCC 700544 / DSM 17151 / LMG 18924 / NCIMB 13744 / C4D1M) TaxID=396598 RepID=B1FUT1_PARG4|nr:oxidoreductase [Paraburkholderia graminis]AXF11989.1 oxidoreductase [Paraburkholderia graminis]EDT12236.1 short-chain dehydrogenase/reductase SDR [Paraburkholderia graminis C4D1M]MDR6470943.1 NAD(P)-dependent dehydrogenase (short-subunit alcohol dehydrogenase family) [Paraburkholderia graminis]MDR6476673.1 NAD(P)-dependent dehydrogenase (short-subunit alcohol dehydrogenase family) [Paraburkholderia graminis]CAB3721046.1 3-phenylpropionate-dihydrodiol/cinnamic acid-dihydrodiol dehydrogenase 